MKKNSFVWIAGIVVVLAMTGCSAGAEKVEEEPKQEQAVENPEPVVEEVEEEPELPVWEDVSGLWISSVGSEQKLIDLDDENSEMVWSHSGEMLGDCFFGGGQPRGSDVGGGLILFCPAGADTPTHGVRGNELRFSEVDDVSQDRIWMWQGEGATPWYRG